MLCMMFLQPLCRFIGICAETETNNDKMAYVVEQKPPPFGVVGFRTVKNKKKGHSNDMHRFQRFHACPSLCSSFINNVSTYYNKKILGILGEVHGIPSRWFCRIWNHPILPLVPSGNVAVRFSGASPSLASKSGGFKDMCMECLQFLFVKNIKICIKDTIIDTNNIK